jgi:serine/threonine protein kinase
VTAQPVAIKRLRSDRGDGRRFAREAAVLSAIEHPGVVRYLDSGLSDEGEPFLVMEWLEGEDLGARLERGPLSVGQAVALARQVAQALDAAHRRGVVHRDLKPANVFLVRGRLRAAKLVDFGLARGEQDDGVSVPGTVLGTPAYMAPEQVRGERTDARADVYALGGLLFSCLTGRPPFRGANPVALLATVLLDAAPHPRDYEPAVPEALDALVHRMLSKSPGKRPADGGAVLDALDAAGLLADPDLDADADLDTSLLPARAGTRSTEQLDTVALRPTRSRDDRSGSSSDSGSGPEWFRSAAPGGDTREVPAANKDEDER